MSRDRRAAEELGKRLAQYRSRRRTIHPDSPGCHYCGEEGWYWRDGARTCRYCYHHLAQRYHENWHECDCAECRELRSGYVPAEWIEVKKRVYSVAQEIRASLTRSEIDRLNSEDGILASDAERNAAVERLRVAAGEGRLTPEGLEARVSLALSAVRRPALEALLRDLPEETAPVAPKRQPDPDPLPSMGDVIVMLILCVTIVTFVACCFIDPVDMMRLIGSL